MRHSKLFALTLLSATILSLTACNNTEPVAESTIESSVETEESIAENTTTTETTTEAPTEEIHLQEDGTYYVSDELRQKFKEYTLFSNWNDEQFEIGLQNFMKKFYPDAQSEDELFSIAESLSKDIEEAREQAKQEYIAQQATGKEDVNPTGAILIKDSEGDIVCTRELTEAIHLSLSKAGIDPTYRAEILQSYYDATLDRDNLEIYQDIIDKLVDSLKKEIEAKENVEVDDNGYVYEDNNEYPSGNIYEEDGPRMDDPTAGKEIINITDEMWDNMNESAGDGGELITDIEIKPAGE